MATTVGHAQIQISPELNKLVLRKFEASFKTAMRGIAKRNPLQVQFDTHKLHTQLKTAVAAAQRGVNAKIGIDLDVTYLKSRIRAALLAAVKGESIKVPITVHGGTALAARVKTAVAAAERFAKIEAKVDFDRKAARNVGMRLGHSIFSGFHDTLIQNLRGRIQLLRSAFVALRPVMLMTGVAFTFVATKAIQLAGSLGQATTASFALPVALGAIVQGLLPVFLATSNLSTSLKNYGKDLAKAGGASEEFGSFIQSKVVPGLQEFEARLRGVMFPRFMEAWENLSEHGEAFGDVMEKTAEKVGELVVRLSEWATTERSLRDFGIIGKANIRIFEDLGLTAINLLDILRNLWVAAIPLTERFTSWLSRATFHLRALTEAAADDGRLKKFFDRAGDAAAQWGRILGNVAVSLFNIFKAITPLTNETTDNLEELTERFRDWTGSDEGQEKILRFFQFFQDLDWERIFKGMGAVAGAMAAINVARSAFSLAGVIAPLAALGPLGVLAGIALGGVAIGLVGLVGAFGAAYAQNEEFRDRINETAESIVNTVRPAFEGFDDVLRDISETLTPALDTLLTFTEDFVAGFAEAIPSIMDRLPELADAVAELAVSFERLNKEFEEMAGMGIGEFLGKLLGAEMQRNLFAMTGLVNLFSIELNHSAGSLHFFTETLKAMQDLDFNGWVNSQLGAFGVLSSQLRIDWRGMLDGLLNDWRNYFGASGFIMHVFEAEFVPTFSELFNSMFGASGLIQIDFRSGLDGLLNDWRNYFGITGFVAIVWESFILWYGNTLRTFQTNVGRAWQGFLNMLRDAWRGTWTGIQSFFAMKQVGILEGVRTFVNGLSDRLSSGLRAAKGFAEGFIGFFARIPQKIADALNKAIDVLRSLAQKIKNIPGVGTILDGVIRGLGPLRSPGVISSVISGVTTTLPRFATGGFVSGPGTATSDSVPARLSAGEYVINAAAVQRFGKGYFEAINRGMIQAPGFREGGEVEGQRSVSPKVLAVQRWIAAQAGKPYVLGTAGPSTYDCSGIASAVHNALVGGGVRYSTYSLGEYANAARYGYKPGPGTYTIAWSHPGQRGASSGDGHMMGNLGGLDFEATPPKVLVGNTRSKLGDFTHVAHLASQGDTFFGSLGGALVKTWKAAAEKIWNGLKGRFNSALGGLDSVPFGPAIKNMVTGVPGKLFGWLDDQDPGSFGFDQGGWLAPGHYGGVYNASGKPEPVLTAQQWAAVHSLAGTTAEMAQQHCVHEEHLYVDGEPIRVIAKREVVRNNQEMNRRFSNPKRR